MEEVSDDQLDGWVEYRNSFYSNEGHDFVFGFFVEVRGMGHLYHGSTQFKGWEDEKRQEYSSRLEAKDLKVGSNYFYKGRIITLDVSDLMEIDKNLLELLRPITLTVDRLTRLGFESINGVSWKKGDIVVEDTDGPFDISITDVQNMVFAVSVEYVHQLQLLSFALTGHELLPK